MGGMPWRHGFLHRNETSQRKESLHRLRWSTLRARLASLAKWRRKKFADGAAATFGLLRTDCSSFLVWRIFDGEPVPALPENALAGRAVRFERLRSRSRRAWFCHRGSTSAPPHQCDGFGATGARRLKKDLGGPPRRSWRCFSGRGGPCWPTTPSLLLHSLKNGPDRLIERRADSCDRLPSTCCSSCRGLLFRPRLSIRAGGRPPNKANRWAKARLRGKRNCQSSVKPTTCRRQRHLGAALRPRTTLCNLRGAIAQSFVPSAGRSVCYEMAQECAEMRLC